MTGTFKDRDGEAVTLTASKGTVTPTGGGAWSWTYPTGNDDSQYVYITATDAGGAKGQIPFFLKINNTGPALNLPGAQTAEQGSAVSFAITATDPDLVDPLTFSASGLPAGLTLKDNGNETGTVSGTVTAAPGQYNPNFTANDSKNPVVTGVVPIKVTPDTTTATLVASKPEVLDSKGGITVGCRFSKNSLKDCTGTGFVGGKSVGAAKKTLTAAGTRSVNIRIPLSKATRATIAKSLAGTSVTVRVSGTRFELVRTLTASAKLTVVPATVAATPTAPAFGTNSATLTKGGTSFLKSIAKRVKTAKTITCTGYPDRATRSSKRRALARARASAACKALKKAKLKGKFKLALASRPAGSTKKPLRVKITIAR
jgi:outer membrane protein OmpA-like peptidoglycan-associated protein